MFGGLFKKSENNKKRGSLKAATPEGEKISKPISRNIQGVLRESLEKMAYTLENSISEDQHVITFVATVDPDTDTVEQMDCAFVRASDESIAEMLMQVGLKDDTFAKAMIACASALQFHKPSLKSFADDLDNKVKEAQRNGDIPSNSNYKKKSNSKGSKRNLSLDSLREKGIDLNSISKASDEEIDDIIDNLMEGLNDED